MVHPPLWSATQSATDQVPGESVRVAPWATEAGRSALERYALSASGAQQADAQLALAWQLRQIDEARSRALADAALGTTDAGDRRRACRRVLLESEFAWLHARLDAARQHADAALRAAQDCGDAAAAADALVLLALIEFDQGAGMAAVDHLVRSEQVARDASDHVRHALAQVMQGYWSASGHIDGVEAEWSARMADWRASNDLVLAMWAHDFKAQMERRRGNFVAAIEAYQATCRLALQIGQLRRAITACANICTNYLNLHDHEAALAWAEEGLALARPAAWPASMGICLTLVGRILTVLGRHDAAQEALDEAVRFVAPLHGSRTAVIAGYYASELQRLRGDHASGVFGLAGVVANAERAGSPDLAQMACIGLAKGQLALGRLKQARSTAEKALAMARHDRSVGIEMAALNALAEVHRAFALREHDGSAAAAAAASLPFRLEAVKVMSTITDYNLDPGYWDALATDQAALGYVEEAYQTACKAGHARDVARRGELSRRAMALAAREQLGRAQAERQQQVADAERAEELAMVVRQAHDTLHLVGRVGQEVTAERDFARLLTNLHRHLGNLLDAPCMAVWLIDRATEMPKLSFVGESALHRESWHSTLADDSPEAECLRTSTEVLRILPSDPAGASTVPLQCFLSGPLTMGGQTLGVLSVASPKPDAYGDRERFIFRTLCAHAAIALENSRVVAELDATRKALESSHEAERLSRQEAQEATRLRSAFVAHVASDLKLPLATLQTSIDTAIDDLAGSHMNFVPPPLVDALVQSLQVNQLARELLDLARLESAAVEVNAEAFSLAELVQDLAHQIDPSPTQAACRLRITMEGRPGPVLAEAV